MRLFGSRKGAQAASGKGSKTSSKAAQAIARGDAARDRRNWAAAAANYREALDHDPDLAGIRVQYGHALKEDGQLSEAAEAYGRAAEAMPDDAELAGHLAHVRERLAELGAAGVDDGAASDAIARGDAARDVGDWATAAAAYGEALEIDPGRGAIRVQYGHALKEDGRMAEAAEAYAAAAEAMPENADPSVHLGHVLKGLGRTGEAIEAFRRAVALNPSDRESADEIFYLGQISQPAGDGDADVPLDPSEITRLDDLGRTVRPGVSVVTCSRNRTENLVRALPSWLAYEEVNEIIVVDWTSDEPVHAALTEADLLDPRVRVIRIEDEPRWILSVAFNAGFRAATREKILKVDADIVLKGQFFARNTLEPGTFLAGNWRDAEPGQEFINGFFFVHREDLMAVGGFNEQITTYGWDDDDIYDRLQESGIRRVGVKVDTITHLPHDDAARLELKTTHFPTAGAEFLNRTSTKINANRIMCFLMPGWHKGMQLQPFSASLVQDDLAIARRSTPPPYVVPDSVQSDVEYYTIVQYLSSRMGRIAYGLNRDQLDLVMCCDSLKAVTPLAVMVAQTRPDRLSRTGNYLIVTIHEDIRHDPAALSAALTALDTRAAAAGLGMVVSDPGAEALRAQLETGVLAPVLTNAPGAGAIDLDGLDALDGSGTGQSPEEPLESGACRSLHLSQGTAAALGIAPAPAAPSVHPGRDKLYIDAQHGLGNRLRAMASAAAVAEKAGRELVIVWEADHHCECELSDLFDYDGPVMTRSFTNQALDTGLVVYNYMEIEDGSARDAPVILTPGVSAYARSAYVLNTQLSDWHAENAFLRQLKPTANVLDLVNSVRSPNAVGVHVRMEAGPGLDGNSYDSPENWPEEDHALIQEWRTKSHFSNFMTRLDAMISADEADTIFIAADLPETYAAFAKTYGDRVAYLERTLYDRSREQMYYALADAILLSQCDAMLGSNWSSFSEIALRLSTTFDRIQLSGEDF